MTIFIAFIDLVAAIVPPLPVTSVLVQAVPRSTRDYPSP
ncbi:exported hypothetical protein [Candidatus Sulfotelmatomonas gaucii]|uniref:Uncharacterized protein n=1 Tax=Candidatus Sulfuritelmatomonas gaucii TaxID=2043161 RepID=A0A2N9LVA5_9BACT|nr:exported hypothetical protein [Candidatus Sulfotelmatomonas gaucii]